MTDEQVNKKLILVNIAFLVSMFCIGMYVIDQDNKSVKTNKTPVLVGRECDITEPEDE